MSFRDIDLKNEYRSFSDNIVKEFYIPVLNEATLYRRAVGFFSSSALAEISKGISGLLYNGGKIQLIASPKLSDEDIEAIDKGYKLKEEVIETNLINALGEPTNFYEEERLNLLAHLIASDRLEIKIALLNSKNKIGIYHEKLGIVRDAQGNVIAFTGSLNESANAMCVNYESFDVYTSWADLDRINSKENAFDRIWNNKEIGLQVLEFPKINKKIIDKYKREEVTNIHEDSPEYTFEESTENLGPHVPEKIKFHDYQLEAIQAWRSNDYRGIFDMATGTGKTFTGIGGIIDIYNYLNGKLAVVIVCPYTHLVEQWVDELNLFNIKPIVAYSESSNKNYKRDIKDGILDYNLGVQQFLCIITTNATYRTDFIQENLRKIRKDALIVVDEAHNFGAENLGSKLLSNFNYRLALSATLERHNDEYGTGLLYNYFGEKCITYSLERAIREGKLTQYYYYPILVTLTDGELEKYKLLTRDIGKNIIKSKSGKTKLNEKGKMLALERARLVAGASNKSEILKEIMSDYKDDSHLLVYCGATNVFSDELDEVSDLRQIDHITDILGNELNMKVSQFTSKENNEERKIIKDKFQDGSDLQVLVAIKCLDEGVNIPRIKTAFILASTTNPKEYIQRRGRVLRLSEGKEYAEIYDFITVPRDLDTVKSYIETEIKGDRSLVKNEIIRMREFRELSLNPAESDKLIDLIEDSYGSELLNSNEELGEVY